MKIRMSHENDIPCLKNIWQICFGDGEEYINFFFDNLYEKCKTVVCEIDKTPVGVTYLIPAKLNDRDFYYGYAIGVLPEYRGNDICKKMLESIKDMSEKENFIFGLHPANDKLFSFYKKIGLNEMYSLKTFETSSSVSDSNFILTDIDAKEFFNFRKNAFNNLVVWDLDTIKYIIKEADITNGFAKKISIDGKDKLIFGKVYDGVVYVKETTLCDDEIELVSGFLKEYFNAKEIIYTLSKDVSLNGEVKTCILGFGEVNDDVYMNIFLD